MSINLGFGLNVKALLKFVNNHQLAFTLLVRIFLGKNLGDSKSVFIQSNLIITNLRRARRIYSLYPGFFITGNNEHNICYNERFNVIVITRCSLYPRSL